MSPKPSSQRPSSKEEATFHIHLIAIAGRQRRPRVRMLLVAPNAVYEGLGTWAGCVRWVKQLHCLDPAKHDLDAAKRDFGRNRYAVFREVTASLPELESLGLQRVDRATEDSSPLPLPAPLAD